MESGLLVAKRNLSDKLIHKNSINEEMKLIEGSNTDYITPSGKIYKWYHDDLFYPKKTYINNKNNYVYVGITFSDGKNRSRRLHVLMAKAFIPNPDPENFKKVGHKDDNKQHNELSNLYWTNTQENTQSAFDHGLATQLKAEDNKNSVYIKVVDPTNNKIVGVYGSIRECNRCIDNVDIGFLERVYKKKNYKPRSKKYIYQEATKEEFENNIHLRSVKLSENPKVDKSPKIFYLINDDLKYKEKFDNQTTASKICGIPQATISKMIKKGVQINGWRCEYIAVTTYIQASSYQNLLNTVNSVTIQDIKTKEIKILNTIKELKEFLNLNGNDILQYFKKGHILMEQWKIISIDSKEDINNFKLENIS